MTQTERRAARAIRTMVRNDRLSAAAERAGDWKKYRAHAQMMLKAYNRARRLGVSDARLMRVGLTRSGR